MTFFKLTFFNMFNIYIYLTFSQFDIFFNATVIFSFADVEISSISQKVGLVMLVLRLLKFSIVAKSCGCQRRRVFKL